MDKYGVLAFHDQNITDAQQIAFSTVLGPLEVKSSSWYVGANIPGKPRVFMPYIGGLPAYIGRCEAVVAKGIRGFFSNLTQLWDTVGRAGSTASGILVPQNEAETLMP